MRQFRYLRGNSKIGERDALTEKGKVVCRFRTHLRLEFPPFLRWCETLPRFAATPFEMDHVGLGGQDLPAEEVDRRRAGGRVGPPQVSLRYPKRFTAPAVCQFRPISRSIGG